MSVILQAFLHNPSMRHYFLADRHNRQLCDREGVCLGCEVDKMFTEVSDSSVMADTPRESSLTSPSRLLSSATVARSKCGARRRSCTPCGRTRSSWLVTPSRTRRSSSSRVSHHSTRATSFDSLSMLIRDYFQRSTCSTCPRASLRTSTATTPTAPASPTRPLVASFGPRSRAATARTCPLRPTPSWTSRSTCARVRASVPRAG